MTAEQIHTYCAMCVSRCGVLATVLDGVLTRVTADPNHPNGGICVKGTAAPELISSPDRLRYPLVRTRPKGDPDPGWQRLTWDEALTLAATRLLEIKARYGPEAVAVSVATPSGSAAHDFNRWAWRLASAFGSPNLMATTHICQWHRDYGASYTYGVGTPPPDFEQTRCLLLWGFNPQVSWPTMAMRIARARARGAKLIVIDPRRTGLAEKADLWLRVRPGADGALALGLIHVLLTEDRYDRAFVCDWTNAAFLVREDSGQLLTAQDLAPDGDARQCLVWDGNGARPVPARVGGGYEAKGVVPALGGRYSVALAHGQTVACRPVLQLLAELAAQYVPERAEALTWVPADAVRRAARLFASETPSCYYTWAGLEQRVDAMQTNRAVALFYALTGQFDRRGSNMLFASTPTNPIVSPALLSPKQAARRLGFAERPLGLARLPGVVRAADVYRAIQTGQPYPVKGLLAFGSDPLVAHADPLVGKQALDALDFYVHVDLFANPSAACADLLLPAASCWESEAVLPGAPPHALAEHTGTWAQYRPAVVKPVGEARPDLAIIFELAQRLGLGEPFFGGDIEAALNHHLAPSGLTLQQLREHPMGMRVPGETRERKYAEIDSQTGEPRGFETPTRVLEIYATRFAEAGYPPLPVVAEPEAVTGQPDLEEWYPLVLIFFRVVQFCDDGHRNLPRLRRQVREPYLAIHPATAAGLGIADTDGVIVETPHGAVTLWAKLDAALDPRVVATQYGWWQACQALGAPAYDPFCLDGANANLLIPADPSDPISGSVAHRTQRCRVRRA
ncbi:MAG TPA: molybdopterin-dependent oxidoreductase [Dehalococcoidia bacterium]|nr:molybdopterin-dependent oxidoreductase [Dehalococcoidia bacterium]